MSCILFHRILWYIYEISLYKFILRPVHQTSNVLKKKRKEKPTEQKLCIIWINQYLSFINLDRCYYISTMFEFHRAEHSIPIFEMEIGSYVRMRSDHSLVITRCMIWRSRSIDRLYIYIYFITIGRSKKCWLLSNQSNKLI